MSSRSRVSPLEFLRMTPAARGEVAEQQPLMFGVCIATVVVASLAIVAGLVADPWAGLALYLVPTLLVTAGLAIFVRWPR